MPEMSCRAGARRDNFAAYASGAALLCLQFKLLDRDAIEEDD